MIRAIELIACITCTGHVYNIWMLINYLIVKPTYPIITCSIAKPPRSRGYFCTIIPTLLVERLMPVLSRVINSIPGDRKIMSDICQSRNLKTNRTYPNPMSKKCTLAAGAMPSFESSPSPILPLTCLPPNVPTTCVPWPL